MQELCMMNGNFAQKKRRSRAVFPRGSRLYEEGIFMLSACAPPAKPVCGRMRDHDDGGSAGNCGFGSQDGPELLANIMPAKAPGMRPAG